MRAVPTRLDVRDSATGFLDPKSKAPEIDRLFSKHKIISENKSHKCKRGKLRLMLETRFTFGQSGKVTLDERSWIAEVDDAIPVVRVESGWLVRSF